jgi:acyl-CoA synthetase (AMP-forming)/AMP-acid ligase II
VFVLERRGARRFELAPLVPEKRSLHVVPAVDPLAITPESDCLLIATSGSASAPKFVRLSHRAVLANTKMHVQSLGLSAPPRSLQILPVNYSYGLVASLLGTLSSEGTVLFTQIDLPSICSAVALRADLCHSTPPFLRFLFENASSEQLDVIRRLRRITIGGDTCPLPQRRRIAETLPDSLAYITYGLTEAGPRVATLAPELFLEHGDSVGLALQGVELRVMGDGVPSAAGTAGNLEIRSPSLMSGYLEGAGGANAEMIVDGWLRTGEIASVDAGGFLRIVGRGDRQVKFRGRRVNPATVEACLARHPAIAAARVRPVRVGDVEQLTAQVYHRGAADVARLEAELRLLCRRELPAYLVPDEIDLQPSPDYFLKDSFLTIRQDGAKNAQ